MVCSSHVWARMSSLNYTIERDAILSGGQEDRSSDNYKLRDSVGGQIAVGFSSSTAYAFSSAGYRQQEEKYQISLTCQRSKIILTGLKLSGRLDWESAWIECTVTSSDPSGYVFRWRAETEDLINTENSNYRIKAITHTTPAPWPSEHPDGSGWGARIGISSANYNSHLWGTTNGYEDTAYWVQMTSQSTFQAATSTTATPSEGDTHRIYFGAEIAKDTVVPEGEYTNKMHFTAVPTF